MINAISQLNEKQKLPVMDTEGAVLVLAGAGSGKTKVLTTRIAHLIADKNVSPYQILAITFTNKAAKEMTERIEAACGCSGIWVSTIHSMCTRILRTDIDRLGFSKNFTIYGEEEKKRLLKRIIETDFEIDDEKFLKKCTWAISDAKNRNVFPEQFAARYAEMEVCDLIADVYAKYEAELLKVNSLDFDDLLLLTYRLLATQSDVAEKYSRRFMYIHIDEFQDTNEVQFEIVKLLAGAYGNIFAVGDDDQSIYGWRGAEIKNILNFAESFPGAKIYKLEQNYRSTKKILQAANSVISKNSERMDKQLWTENQDGVKTEYFSGADETQEAYYIVSQMKALMASCGYSYSDFAVLMRVNALSRSIEQEFLKYNIPYKMYGGFKFYERKEIKDALAYVRMIVNPFDDDAVLRVINVPKRGIGLSSAEALANYAKSRNMPLTEAVLNVWESDLSAAAKSKIAKFGEVLNALKQFSEGGSVSELVSFLLDASGIYAMYAGEDDESVNKRLNLEELLNSVSEFERQNEGATAADFLQSVTLSSDIDSMGEGDTVTLATVHAVKGLEFKAVFIAGMDDGLFPLSRAKDNVAEMEEERRLMYVAVTRAEDRLYVTRAESRYLFGKRDFTLRSRFLEEMGVISQPPIRKTNTYAEIPPFGRSVSSVIGKTSEVKKDLSKCVVGQKVRHRTFGDGVIISVQMGDNPTVDIAFQGIGMKTLAVNIAPIEFITD